MARRTSNAVTRNSPDETTTTEPRERRRTLELGLLSQVLGFRFKRIQNHLAESLSQMPKMVGAKSGEFSALAIISANPGLSQVELSDEVGLDRGSVVAMVDDFEQRGWARRERAADDRRRNLLFVTPAGQKMLEQMFQAAKANEVIIHGVLSDQEFDHLCDMLDRLYRECFEQSED
jgi:DNA-binding MarR family transcriptional regulator